MSYWGQEVLPVDLRAYWKLDEAEGNIAYNSVGQNDALLIGGPVWRPTDGMVDGALQFDGVDDTISTPSIINPFQKNFSVFTGVSPVAVLFRAE